MGGKKLFTASETSFPVQAFKHLSLMSHNSVKASNQSRLIWKSKKILGFCFSFTSSQTSDDDVMKFFFLCKKELRKYFNRFLFQGCEDFFSSTFHPFGPIFGQSFLIFSNFCSCFKIVSSWQFMNYLIGILNDRLFQLLCLQISDGIRPLDFRQRK